MPDRRQLHVYLAEVDTVAPPDDPGSGSGMTPDAEIVQAARGGDRSAFARLYDLYARMIHGILLARVPADDADDLVHEVFLTALRRLDTLRDNAAFGAWLATIARNRVQ